MKKNIIIIFIALLLIPIKVMATTITKNPGAYADVTGRAWGYPDVFVPDTFGTLAEDGASLIGHWAQLFEGWFKYTWETAIRFPNVPIANSITILSATLTIKTPSGGGWDDLDESSLDIQACDEDNSAQMSSFANFGSRSRTTANINWVETFDTTANTFTSPDIKTVIQEIVDRGSWASGNAIQLIVSDHTYKYDNDPPDSESFAYCVANDVLADYDLSITYSVGGYVFIM